MNRRAFVRIVAGSTALPLSNAVGLERQTMTHIVADVRLLDVDAISKGFAPRGSIVHKIKGDITPLWQQVLLQVWREGLSPVIGYTRYSEFFVLQELARDHEYMTTHSQEEADQIAWVMSPPRDNTH